MQREQLSGHAVIANVGREKYPQILFSLMIVFTENLDYLQQMLNGWFLNVSPYEHGLGILRVSLRRVFQTEIPDA